MWNKTKQFKEKNLKRKTGIQTRNLLQANRLYSGAQRQTIWQGQLGRQDYLYRLGWLGNEKQKENKTQVRVKTTMTITKEEPKLT